MESGVESRMQKCRQRLAAAGTPTTGHCWALAGSLPAPAHIAVLSVLLSCFLVTHA